MFTTVNATINIKRAKVDIKEFKYRADIIVETAMKIYLRTFIRSAIKIIPVYSGMAQGALLAIGDLIGDRWAINPATRTRVSNRGGVGRVTSRAAEGKALSSAKIVKIKGNDIVGREFRFVTSVKHLIILDSQHYTGPIKLKHPTPWNAFEKSKSTAKKAASDYIRNRLRARKL